MTYLNTQINNLSTKNFIFSKTDKRKENNQFTCYIMTGQKINKEIEDLKNMINQLLNIFIEYPPK
jgi:hypothetical protein